MSFGSAVSSGFSKYGTFSGRATRSEFWWWYLFVIIVTLVPVLLAVVILAATSASMGESSGAPVVIAIILYVVAVLISLALLVPTYAVGCRRLHDKGISGWLQLLILVPCGNIVLIVLWALAGQPQDNQYGPPPA